MLPQTSTRLLRAAKTIVDKKYGSASVEPHATAIELSLFLYRPQLRGVRVGLHAGYIEP